MGIVIIILVVVIAVILLLLLFKILKWVFLKKARIVWMCYLLLATVVSTTTYKLFFVKMEFIQSKVYPNLYIIKNKSTDRTIVNTAIEEKVFEVINTRCKDENKQNFILNFYEYTKGDWGESGTAYFIEHKERRDGMTAELLEYYQEYLIATFSFQPCEEDAINYFGELNYYSDRKLIKTDTLFNSCKE